MPIVRGRLIGKRRISGRARPGFVKIVSYRTRRRSSSRHAQLHTGGEIQIAEIASGEIRRAQVHPHIGAVPEHQELRVRGSLSTRVPAYFDASAAVAEEFGG